MPVSSGIGCVHHTGHVTVADKADCGTRRAHFLDQTRMARAIHDAGGDFIRLHALRLGDRHDVVRRAGIEIDDALRVTRTDGDLFHIDVRRVKQVALLGNRDHRKRVWQVLGADRRAFQRIERDIDVRPLFGTNFFADVEHRRFVTLALADNHRSGNRKAVQFLAHCIDGRLIGSHFVAAAPQPRRRHCCTLGHADQFECENAIESVGLLLCGLGHLNKVLNSNCVDGAHDARDCRLL